MYEKGRVKGGAVERLPRKRKFTAAKRIDGFTDQNRGRRVVVERGGVPWEV